MTQQQLALLVGVDASTVCRWEARKQIVDDHKKGQLASIFLVTKAQLMGWDAIDGLKSLPPEPASQDVVA